MAWQTLEEVMVDALGCTRCALSNGRTQVVWMDGNPESDLMFIGEAPGFNEDKIGKPFVGAAGKLLDSLLSGIELDRSTCTICNVLKCRPPNNRDPLPEEIETCNPFLEAQIRFISPRLIVTLGNFATRYILGKGVSISRVRGQRFEAFGAIVIPTYHPAAALHGGGERSPVMTSMRADFDLIKSILDTAQKETMDADKIDIPAEQPSLF